MSCNHPYMTTISIHAPREGCDMAYGETYEEFVISIHAPREGCDAVAAGKQRI